MLSLVETTMSPFTAKASVEPTAVSDRVVPAASGLVVTPPSWDQLPLSRKNSISSGLPLSQK